MKKILLIMLFPVLLYSQKFEAENMDVIIGSIENSYVYLVNENNQLIQSISDSGYFKINIRYQADNGIEKLMIVKPDNSKDTLIFEGLEWNVKSYETVCNSSGQWQFVYIEDSPWYNRLKVDWIEFLKGDSIINNNYDVEVSWQANTESDLAGYKIYYGLESGNYLYTINVNNVTEYIIKLSCGYIYYFAMTAYDIAENESDFSDEVILNLHCEDNIPPAIPQIISIKKKESVK